METEESDVLSKKRSNHCQRKMDARKATAKLPQQIEDQFTTGRLYGEKFPLVSFGPCSLKYSSHYTLYSFGPRNAKNHTFPTSIIRTPL